MSDRIELVFVTTGASHRQSQKDRPGRTRTIDGILELEEGKLRVTLIKAVVKAAQRAKELAFVS